MGGISMSWVDDLMRFKGFWSASFTDKCKWILLALFFYALWLIVKIKDIFEERK